MVYVLFVLGIGLLVKGAGFLVEGASALAARSGFSNLAVGLTVVSVGTSLPELVISILAAFRASEGLVLGNVIGSSLVNILLILGVLACLTRLRVKNSTTWKEIPFAFLAAVVLTVMVFRPDDAASGGNVLSRSDGFILILFFAIFLYYVFELAVKNRQVPSSPIIRHHSSAAIILMLAAGSAGLYLGGEWTVGGAVHIAEVMGMSEFLISAAVIAVGTSLPELATALTAVSREKVDLAVGNVIGSNILNVFWILGLTSLLRPLRLPAFMRVDTMVLLVATLALFLFMFTSRKHELDRWEGVFFLAIYAVYMGFLFLRG